MPLPHPRKAAAGTLPAMPATMHDHWCIRHLTAVIGAQRHGLVLAEQEAVAARLPHALDGRPALAAQAPLLACKVEAEELGVPAGGVGKRGGRGGTAEGSVLHAALPTLLPCTRLLTHSSNSVCSPSSPVTISTSGSSTTGAASWLPATALPSSASPSSCSLS